MQKTLQSQCSFALLALATACGDNSSPQHKVTETTTPVSATDATTTADTSDSTTDDTTAGPVTTTVDPTTSATTDPASSTDTSVTSPLPTCGNGIAEPGEGCDDGNADETDECTSLCRVPSCNDLLKSGDEADLDCGGSCPGCGAGLDCSVGDDCESGECEGNQCGPGCVTWTRQWGTGSNDSSTAVAVDADDNVFVVGHRDSDVATLKKFNASGGDVWSKIIDGTADLEVYGVAVDGAGDVVVTGQVLGKLDDNAVIGKRDAFILKFDTAGTKVWSRQFGSIDGDIGREVAIDGADNVIVVGDALGPVDGVDPVGAEDVMVAKFSAQGDKLWTRLLGSSGFDRGNGVATDSAGDIYVVGEAGADFDGQVALGLPDAFITKFDASGAKQWTHQFGTSQGEYGADVAVDGADMVYVTGTVVKSFDGHRSLGGADVFLIKYDGGGMKQWSRQFGTNFMDYGRGIVATGAGQLLVTGTTTGDFDGHPHLGGTDLFVANFDAGGLQHWTEQFGTFADDDGAHVAALSTNTPVIVGRTKGDFWQDSLGGSDSFASHMCLP